MNTDKISPKLLIFLIVILVIGFLLRLNQSLNFHLAFAGDPCRDFYMAKEIALNGAKNVPPPECGGCWSVGGSLLKNSSLYFYFLSIPYFLFQSPLGISLFNIVNGLLFCLFSFLVICKISNERIAVFSLIIAIFSKFFIFYNSTTFQPYYVGTFSAIIIWLLLKNKFWSTALALVLGFISTEIHFATLPLFIFIFYRIVSNYKKFKTFQKIILILLVVSFSIVFIKFNLDLSVLGETAVFISIAKRFSILNIYNNISDIYSDIFSYQGLFLLILLIVALNINKFKIFYPLILTLLFTGFIYTIPNSGYYSVYYLLFLFTIGFCIDSVYSKNKYIAIILLIVFLIKSNPRTFFDQIHYDTLKNYKNDWFQQSIINEINNLNPRNLPVSDGFKYMEPINPYYYYANNYDLNSYLKIKDNISKQEYNEGILMCSYLESGLCPFIEENKDKREFTLINTIDGHPFYYWQRK